MDGAEAWINAIAGLAVSWCLIWALRMTGLWDAPAVLVSAFFFVASVGRSYAIRKAFRWLGRTHETKGVLNE